jgi:hypothetical protein
VLIVDVMAWARPRYVFCRKLKENLSFWQIETRVPVVLRPCDQPVSARTKVFQKKAIHQPGGRKKIGR